MLHALDVEVVPQTQIHLQHPPLRGRAAVGKLAPAQQAGDAPAVAVVLAVVSAAAGEVVVVRASDAESLPPLSCPSGRFSSPRSSSPPSGIGAFGKAKGGSCSTDLPCPSGAASILAELILNADRTGQVRQTAPVPPPVSAGTRLSPSQLRRALQ